MKKKSLALLLLLLCLSGIPSCSLGEDLHLFPSGAPRQAGYTIQSPTDLFADNLPHVDNQKSLVAELVAQFTETSGYAWIILDNYDPEDDKLFGSLENAVTNCASRACEADSATYLTYPIGGDLQVLYMRLIFVPTQDTITKADQKLAKQIEKYGQKLKSKNYKNPQDAYEATFEQVLSLASYDDSLAEHTDAQTLSGQMHLNRTAYGALVTGKTVCSGYARAFKALCDYQNLPCWVIFGTADGIPHAWNAVPLNGKTLYIDCNAADVGYPRTETFLVTLATLKSLNYKFDQYSILPW